jgi:hypothetical protein
MAIQIINVGQAPNDGSGDSLRAAGNKINDNFTELYNALGSTTGRLSLVSSITAANGVSVDSETGRVNISGVVASPTRFGVIKVGNNLTIDSGGVLSANPGNYTLPIADENALGGIKVGANLTIDGSGLLSAVQYVLPTASSTTLGGVRIGARLSIDGNGILSANEPVIPVATTSILGGVKVDGTSITISDQIISVSSDYVKGPASATANAVSLYNSTSGKILKNSLVTISDLGEIVAQRVANIIPFYYADQTAFPDATVYEGAVAFSDADNRVFYSSDGNWISIARTDEINVDTNTTYSISAEDGTTGKKIIRLTASGSGSGSDDVTLVAGSNVTLNRTGDEITISATGGGSGTGLVSRTEVQATTSSIAAGATVNLTITGFKGYALYKVETSNAAWVRIYTSSTARSSDSSRSEGSDPLPGAGVIAEVITTGVETIAMTPAVFGFNDETIPTTDIQLAVTNKGSVSTAITVTLTVVQLED